MKKILSILGGLLLILVFATNVSAAENWRLSGNYTLTFTCTSGCSGDYIHTMVVSLYDTGNGTFSGTGWRNAVPSQTWTVAGDVTGDTIEFLVDYDGSSYYVDADGTIVTDGTISGSAVSSSQVFDWVISPNATFNRYAEITSPAAGESIENTLNLGAYLMDNDYDAVQWAVREGTCAAGTNTVFGNVDGFNSSYSWVYDPNTYKHTFLATANTSTWIPGMYCFIFNPREDSDESDIRLTREFYLKDTTAPIITLEEPTGGLTYCGEINLRAVCNETCDYINFWWRAGDEAYGDYRYHYVHTDGTVFEWGLNTLKAQKADGSYYLMDDGVYYLYAAGKDLVGNWARTPEVQITVENTTKRSILMCSGVPGNGLENAPGLQKPFNEKSQAAEHAGKKK